MSNKRDKGRTANTTLALHQVLRSRCRCSATEIEIILAALQQMIPMDDVEQFRAIYEGRTVSKEPDPRFALNMGRGEIKEFTLNMQHPHMLLLDYLEQKYGHRFGTLFWFAIGETPESFYAFLLKISETSMWASIMTDGDTGVNRGENKR